MVTLNGSSEPLWLVLARWEIGQREIVGESHNQRILEYLATVRGSRGLWFMKDETAWCSAFVNWCVQRSGNDGTRDPAARSWLKHGIESSFRIGAICVLKRGLPWQGHVGFGVGIDDAYVHLLGGNQSNGVCVQRYSRADVLGIRWLQKS